jgi:hypothetical protein
MIGFVSGNLDLNGTRHLVSYLLYVTHNEDLHSQKAARYSRPTYHNVVEAEIFSSYAPGQVVVMSQRISDATIQGED